MTVFTWHLESVNGLWASGRSHCACDVFKMPITTLNPAKFRVLSVIQFLCVKGGTVSEVHFTVNYKDMNRQSMKNAITNWN